MSTSDNSNERTKTTKSQKLTKLNTDMHRHTEEWRVTGTLLFLICGSNKMNAHLPALRTELVRQKILKYSIYNVINTILLPLNVNKFFFLSYHTENVGHVWKLEIISTWRPVVRNVCVCESAVKLCYYLMFLVIILVYKWKVCALMQRVFYHGIGFTPAFSCRRGTYCLYMAPHFRSWFGKEIFIYHCRLFKLSMALTKYCYVSLFDILFILSL